MVRGLSRRWTHAQLVTTFEQTFSGIGWPAVERARTGIGVGGIATPACGHLPKQSVSWVTLSEPLARRPACPRPVALQKFTVDGLGTHRGHTADDPPSIRGGIPVRTSFELLHSLWMGNPRFPQEKRRRSGLEAHPPGSLCCLSSVVRSAEAPPSPQCCQPALTPKSAPPDTRWPGSGRDGRCVWPTLSDHPEVWVSAAVPLAEPFAHRGPPCT